MSSGGGSGGGGPVVWGVRGGGGEVGGRGGMKSLGLRSERKMEKKVSDNSF